MRINSRPLFLFSLLAFNLTAASIEKGERDQLMSHLHATRKQILDFIGPLSDAQWKFKPAPDRWSIAECAEHITETEVMLRGLILKTAKDGPIDESKRTGHQAKRAETVKTVLGTITDRSKRFTAPGEIAPKGRFATKADLIAAFEQRRAETIHYVETTPDDLRGRFFKMGPGEFDLVEMFYYLSGHSERHLLQMKEVAASAGFPKN